MGHQPATFSLDALTPAACPGQNLAVKIEHTAYQVEDPVALSHWYVSHLGLRVKRAQTEPPFGHFLADEGDTVMLEFYRNPAVPVPDYRAMDPLLLHLAFLAVDVPAARMALLAAGATSEGDVQVTGAGDVVAIVRDPWGLCIQIVRRAEPMIG